MYLSAYEKKSLTRFLLIYLLSIYAFIFTLSYTFYKGEVKNTYETHYYKMRAFASELSSQIITAHMMHDERLLACLKEGNLDVCFKNSQEYKVSFYDEFDKPLFLGFEDEVDFTQKFYAKNESLFYIDDSTQNHLGIKLFVLKKENIMRDIKRLQKTSLLYTLLGLILATLLGYVLAKLFLKPIKDEIENLDKFIKDSTHELNTPITAILMSIETLKDIDPKKKKRIELSGKRIASLYGNLSYMLLHDKQNEEKSELDIKKLIEERIEYFYDVIAQKALHVSLHLAEKSLHVNEESMHKLIDNLLSNAIKYNKIQGRLEVVLTPTFLSVKDSGIGIAKDKLGEILKRYKRANSDRGGFGIGLDIINTICQSNQFKLSIISKEEEGSEFRVTF